MSLARSRMSTFLAFLLLVAGICQTSRAQTIIVVRHADRDRTTKHNPLLPEGENRSRWIGRLLIFQHVDHIFYARGEDEKKGKWLRVFQTAQGIYAGLSAAGSAPAAAPQAMPDDDSAFAWLLGAGGTGGHVQPTDHVDIVVLHHEQIPALVNQMIAADQPQVADIDQDDYNNVFILTRQKQDEKFTLIRLSFTPPPATQPADTQPAESNSDSDEK
jgi:hypothetical protein